jgi:branched-chain amino acid transport system substrate-binding protein
MRLFILAFAALALCMPGARAQTQGVAADSIRIGSYTDLSGPLALWGIPATNGIRMRFDEANSAGGVHGRKLEFIVEDMQYQVPRAVQAANKLVRRDRVFAIIAALGTPMNLAVLPQQLDANVPNMYPVTADRGMAVPTHPLKYAFFRSYYDQLRAATKYFHDTAGFETPCVAQIANEAGEEMTHGVVEQLAVHGMEIVAKTEHSATETDFTSSVTTLRNAGCDIIFLSTGVRDTILLVATANRLGWSPTFVTGMVAYMDAVAEAADGAMEGLHLVSPFVYLKADDAEGEALRIITDYQERFGEQMAPQAQLGYIFADLVIEALEAVGPDLTVERFLEATEAISGYVDPIGGQSVSFSPDDHQGVNTLIIAKVENRRWVVTERGLDY